VDKRTLQEQTALLLAVCSGHLPCVRRLLEAGADPDICGKGKDTPLYKGEVTTYTSHTHDFYIYNHHTLIHISSYTIHRPAYPCLYKSGCCGCDSVRAGELGHGGPPVVLRGHSEPAMRPGLDGPARGRVPGQRGALRRAPESRGSPQHAQHLQHHTAHRGSPARAAEGPGLPPGERSVCLLAFYVVFTTYSFPPPLSAMFLLPMGLVHLAAIFNSKH